MAILYKTNFSKTAEMSNFPPSLVDSSYYPVFLSALANYNVADSFNTSFILFDNLTDLTTYVNSIALTAGQQAELLEWQTANNITISYELFDLSASDTTPPAPFGYGATAP